MNRREAVQYMHVRHPKVIDAPGPDVDLEALHLEIFWLQGHVCELLDRRSDKAARRCFETMHEILVRGDADVRPAVWNHFVVPHLVFHEDLEWAKGRMPQLLAELCDKVKEALRETLGGDSPAPANRQP
jgi:hypothetical protein